MNESTKHRRKLATPVEGVKDVDGAWIRPAELLVDLDVEDEVAERLRTLGGAPYDPERQRDNWRLRKGLPRFGDINARLERAGVRVRLWVGFRPGTAERLVLSHELPGLHLNHVFFGEDFYQGGPGGAPAIDAGPPALTFTTGNRTPDIAVLDTGVPADWKTVHPELAKSLLEVGSPIDMIDQSPPAGRDYQAGHGIFIAGLIARMAPTLDIQIVKALTSSGEGDDTTLGLALAETSAAVINLSLGGYTVDDLEPVVLGPVIRDLVGKGRIIVCAAGNDANADPCSANHGRPFWPAMIPVDGVISVGAVDSVAAVMEPWDHTNVGQIYAPGVDLLSTFISGWDSFTGWAKWTGTSFAAPVVAARIAELVAANAADPVKVLSDWLASAEVVDVDASWVNVVPGKLYRPAVEPTVW
jgi:hypothetical protein